MQAFYYVIIKKNDAASKNKKKRRIRKRRKKLRYELIQIETSNTCKYSSNKNDKKKCFVTSLDRFNLEVYKTIY
jgi:hypothetical protein